MEVMQKVTVEVKETTSIGLLLMHPVQCMQMYQRNTGLLQDY